jgi:[ribosomal protein S5]-alanine N-acetyltransferase
MKLPTTYTIETARCRLRIVSIEDMPYIFSATRHKGFNDGMVWDAPRTLDETEAPLRKSIAAWQRGESYAFTIEERDTNDVIGRIGVRPEDEEHIWSVGFWTHPEKQGRGFMSEALPLVIDLAFSRLGAARVEACHATRNIPSKRVLEKMGMRFIKHVPQGFMKNGKWVAEDLLAIEKTDWKEPPNPSPQATP